MWAAALAWLGMPGAMWLIRARGRAEWYRDFHRWMSEGGVPDWARHLDSDVIFLIAGVLTGLLVQVIGPRSGRPLLESAGLSGGPGSRRWAARGLGVGVLIGLPMLLFGAVYAMVRGGLPAPDWSVLEGVLVAPFNEEVVYRGVLVFVLWRVTGWKFWPIACVSAAIFGSAHVTWTLDGWSDGWMNALPTLAGGLWFAWLARRWGESWAGPGRGNIFVPMSLHAMMNLAWAVMQAQGGAVGGMWPNVARGATIALGVLWTLRATGGHGGGGDAPPARTEAPTQPGRA
ncbi:MAG: CPBP family intramembrane metalloprotease [Leptolyngbya sp. PLA3]|nr:MAG: CPBP family intramembrane metalloprotease [Cyanobacteria bacterium CYA]MCE7968203.1 CPBP family intramembrane metalloprotease [Leptolyngbya sp. PL-A3]